MKDKALDLFVSEYERGLLALAYRYLDILSELNHRITSDYFLYYPNKLLYTALCNLAKNPTVNKVDLESLYIESKSLGIEKYGVGPDYIGLITQGGYDKENLSFYIEKVENSYLKYALHQKLEANYALLIKNSKDKDGNLSGQDLINNISTDLSNLEAFSGKNIEGISFAERVEEYVLERANSPTDVRGLRTGFSTLDKTINGLMPGSLTIVAGVAKAGKSTVLLNMADYIAIQGSIPDSSIQNQVLQKPEAILFISTEMYTDEDISRELALRTLLEERGICNGTLYNDPSYKDVLIKGIEQIKKSKIYHVYLPDFNASKVCSLIYQYKMKHDIGLAIFDYIKMSTVGDENRDRKEYQVLGDITTSLKNMAGKLHIPILSACQVNSRSGLVADSDRIARYCNNLIVFTRKSEEDLEEQNFYKYGTHWLDVRIARAGGNIRIPIRFWKKCCKMQEAEFFISEEENNENNLSRELTTPEEWEKMKNEYFKVEKVEEIVSNSKNNSTAEEDEDDLF